MERVELIDQLKDKTNISYEEAKEALENSSWDMLDAIVHLENLGKIEKPSVSIFYTNEYKESYSNIGEIVNIKKDEEESNWHKKNNFQGIFETVCKFIDTCNNIFIEIKRDGSVLLKLPITVLGLLLFFAVWIVIPPIIVGLFFDIEFSIISKRVNTDKVNKIIKEISEHVKLIKEKIKKGFNK